MWRLAANLWQQFLETKIHNFILYSHEKKNKGVIFDPELIYLRNRVAVLIWRTTQTIDATTSNDGLHILSFNDDSLFPFWMHIYNKKKWKENIYKMQMENPKIMWWAFARTIICLVNFLFWLFWLNCMQCVMQDEQVGRKSPGNRRWMKLNQTKMIKVETACECNKTKNVEKRP